MDSKKACCLDATNLMLLASGRADLTVYLCVVCKCRHFEATLDPGKFGLRGTGMGG
jgi:hypothetical protein